jgi:hypothetical protein
MASTSSNERKWRRLPRRLFRKDERYKTEDVTDTKGRDFEDFFLKREPYGIFERIRETSPIRGGNPVIYRIETFSPERRTEQERPQRTLSPA